MRYSRPAPPIRPLPDRSRCRRARSARRTSTPPPGLDRVAHRRRDDGLAGRAPQAIPPSRVVFLSELKVPVRGLAEAPRLHAPRVGRAGRTAAGGQHLPGRVPGCRLVRRRPHGDRPVPDAELVELRTVSLLLPAGEAGLLAYARGLAHWHRGHRFCGWCGGETVASQGGHARHCPACGRDNFPRTDPAVIVLVTHGDRCLLGRSPRFPPGMYSTLAGFVEPGELLEDTLRREVFEEVGVEIGGFVYRASQPWPFPQSLMLGFRAPGAGHRADHRPGRDRGCRLVRPRGAGGREPSAGPAAEPGQHRPLPARGVAGRGAADAAVQPGSAPASGSAAPCSRAAAVRAKRSSSARRRPGATARARAGRIRLAAYRSATISPSSAGRSSQGNSGATAK